jgi:Domain of unknown function (DUF4282)
MTVTDQGYGQGQGQPYQGQTQGAGYQGQGYPAQGYPAGQGYPSAPAPNGSSPKGFFGSLFDVSFSSFVTPTIIKVVYILVMILGGLGALGFVAEGFAVSVIFGIITLIIIAPLIYIVELALWRIALEIFMVIFRMSDDIHAMRGAGGGLR